MKQLIVLASLLFFTSIVFAQNHPKDDITNRRIVGQKLPLAYPAVEERDIFWENRVWRVIDLREKMNLPFAKPERPFLEILIEAATAKKIEVYNTETDDFQYPLAAQELDAILFSTDTIPVFSDAETVEYVVVKNELNYEDVKRFRIKEVWYFDSKISAMKVRILGIAPLIEVYDDFGNFKYEKPLFWVHYPSARKVLAQEVAFTEGNQAARSTWEDVFERRSFASVIYKESDVLGRRLSDMYSGLEQLLEADKIKDEIFNFEQDLWSY